MAIANGIITHIDADKRFAYMTEPKGDSIRIHGSLKDFDQLEKGSDVVLQYENEFIRGEYKKGAKALLEIYAPFEPRTVLGTVIRVSEKGFAFARCDGFEEDVHIGVDVFRKADIKPGRDLPFLGTVGQNVKGFAVIELWWKPQEIAAWRAENLPSETGTLKYFDQKGFGFLIREDGTQIGFHINGVATGLRDDFKKKYRKGSTFKFVIGDYRGKPTALITELVALAPEREVAETAESVEVVAVEATASVEDVVAAPAAESEEKPVKAPRKKAVAKTKADAAPKPVKKGRVRGVKGGDIPSAADYGIHPDDQPADIASMAKSACANGGGALALAMFAAAAPAGNAQG